MGIITITISNGCKASIRTRDTNSNLAGLYADLYERLHKVSEAINGKTKDAYDPGDHPHAPAGSSKGGQFVSHGSGGTSNEPSGPKPTSTKATAAKAAMHELFSSGHPFTKGELMTIAGVKTEKLFSDYIAMLKNPKYAGSAGALQIKKLVNGSYQVVMPDGTPALPPPPAANPASAPSPKPIEPPKAVAPPEAPKPEPAGASYALSTKGMNDKQVEAMFDKHHSAVIDTHFKARFGMSVINGVSVKAQIADLDKQIKDKRDVLAYGNNATLEQKETALSTVESLRAERRKILTNEMLHPAGRLKGHNQVDLDKKSAAATQQRKILGHVYAALEELEARGFNIKEAISKGKVAYVSGSPSKSMGHAWQTGGAGHFSLSGTKCLNDKFNAEQRFLDKKRVEKGQPRWTVGSGPDVTNAEKTRFTVMHELAHALGMQPHIDSPNQLAKVINQHGLNGGMPHLLNTYSADPALAGTGQFNGCTHWIKTNLSEYAATNIKETDAELAAMVTSPKYKPGTLPKEFEQHVYNLFGKKG